MPYLELRALVLAAATWGHLWASQKITFRSDCMPVVQSITARVSRTARSNALIRALHMIAAHHGFDFRCIHIAGVDNIAADALSRGDMQRFYVDTPSHHSTPDVTAALNDFINPSSRSRE